MKKVMHTLRRRGGLFLIRFGVIGAQLLVLLILARLMPRAEFGTFAYGWAAIQFSSALISLGGPGYLLREMSARQAGPEHGTSPVRTLLIAAVGPALLACVVWAILHILIERNLLPLHSTAFAAVIALGGWLNNLVANIAVPIRVSGAPNAAMFYRDGLGHILLLGSGVGLYVMAGSVSALQVLEGFCFLSVLSASLGLALAIVRNRRVACFGRGSQKFSFAFWASGLTAMLAAQIDILIGGMFLGAAQLGSYQILRKAANLLSLPQIIANWSIAVDASRAFAQGDLLTLRATAKEGLSIALLPALGLALILIAASPWIYSWYSMPMTVLSVATFLILTLGSAANVGFGANFLLAAQCRLEHLALRARVIALLAGSVLLIGLTPALGTMGTAIAMSASAILMNALIWLDVRQRTGVDTSVLSLIGHRSRS